VCVRGGGRGEGDRERKREGEKERKREGEKRSYCLCYSLVNLIISYSFLKRVLCGTSSQLVKEKSVSPHTMSCVASWNALRCTAPRITGIRNVERGLSFPRKMYGKHRVERKLYTSVGMYLRHYIFLNTCSHLNTRRVTLCLSSPPPLYLPLFPSFISSSLLSFLGFPIGWKSAKTMKKTIRILVYQSAQKFTSKEINFVFFLFICEFSCTILVYFILSPINWSEFLKILIFNFYYL